MSTEFTTAAPAALGQDERPIRPPHKAALDRLRRVLGEWQLHEQDLCSRYGPPDDLPSGCFRSMRIKDIKALQQTLAYLVANGHRRPKAKERN